MIDARLYCLRDKCLKEVKEAEDKLKKYRDKLRDIDLVISGLIEQESNDERREKRLQNRFKGKTQ